MTQSSQGKEECAAVFPLRQMCYDARRMNEVSVSAHGWFSAALLFAV